MTVEIHVSGASAQEVQAELRKLLGPSGTFAMPHEHGEQTTGVAMLAGGTANINAEALGKSETAPKKTRSRSKKEPEPDKTIPDADEAEGEGQTEADAQDEASEAAAEQGNGQLTHDDVRAALSAYMKKFGIGPTQIDGPRVLAMMFGEKCTKVSDVPNDQASLAKAIAGINEMLNKNGFKRVPV